MRFRCWLIVACLCLTSTEVFAAEDGSPHAERIAAWRKSSDFAAIEDYCQRELERTALTSVERHQLTLELASSALEIALRTPSDEQWRKATTEATIYAERDPSNPRRAQLYLQSALAHRARGEQLLPLAEFDAKHEEPARAELREAIKRFRRARELIETEVRTSTNSARRNVPEGAIPPLALDELRSLERNARFELARALRVQGESYLSGSVDRINAVQQADELFQALGELEDSDPLAWPSRMQQIACRRLLGDHAGAEQGISEALRAKLPPELASAVRTEQLLLAIAANRPKVALELARRPAEQAERTRDEELAMLQAVLLALRVEQNDKQRKILSTEAARRTRSIHDRWGVFWGEHAARLLAREVTSGQDVMGMEVWSQSGDALFQQGKLDKALAAYDQARSAAEDEGNEDAALLLGMKGAALEQSRERFDAASGRFRDLAVRHARHVRAAECHLAAIQCLARAAPDESEQVAWLEEHLRLWPDAETAPQVRLWLAVAREGERKWRASIEQLAKIDARSLLAPEAIDSAARCYDAWLAETKDDVERQAVVDGALRHFAAYSGHGGEEDNSVAPLAAAHVARWLINERAAYSEAERVLRECLTEGNQEDDQAVARAWLLIAQAAQPARETEVLTEIPKLPELPANVCDQLYASLSALPDAAPSLRLAFIDRRLAMRDAKEADVRRRWEILRASALADTGDRAQAIRVLEALRAANPQDPIVCAALGRILTDSTGAAAWKQGLDCWRVVEGQSRPGTAEWFEAKLALAKCHLLLGDGDRAAKILRLTRTLHPELGGPEWKPRFEALLRACEAASTP